MAVIVDNTVHFSCQQGALGHRLRVIQRQKLDQFNQGLDLEDAIEQADDQLVRELSRVPPATAALDHEDALQ